MNTDNTTGSPPHIFYLWQAAYRAQEADSPPLAIPDTGRYARQAQIPGWQQERLPQAVVAIVGSGLLAGIIAWGLAALGIGRIFLLDDERVTAEGTAFPRLDGAAGQLAVAALADTLLTLNPAVTAVGLGHRLWYDAHAAAIPACDLLIEAGNDFTSKLIARAYARTHRRPLILAATDLTSGLCCLRQPRQNGLPDTFLTFHGRPQGIVPALVIGGLVLEEVRQLLHPLPQDKPPATAVAYNVNTPQRFYQPKHLDRPAPAVDPAPVLPIRHALLVGAGALGNFVGLGLALAGLSQLTIVDPDIIEESNLNRQPLFYDAVGQPKATTLAARLRQLAPHLAVTAVTAPVDATHLAGVEAIFACVDNFTTRAQLSDLAVRHGIPLINGGTGPFSGALQVYAPGRSACLNCTLTVEQLATIEAGERVRCGQTPEASVVIANQLIAGLMVGEACRLADPCPGALIFDAANPARLGQWPPHPPCQCHLEEPK